MTRRLLVATTNRGKQEEFRRLLEHLPADIVAPADLGIDLEVEEPHQTYVENAVAKALAYAAVSGELTVADDSGIEVAALGWGPGVRSARWGAGLPGTQAERLVEAIGPDGDRRARMVCALAVAVPASADGPAVEVFTGTVEGRVAGSPRGEGGFGYDPIFELPDGRTTAELSEREKDALSHRGRAVHAASSRLQELLTSD